MVQEFISRVTGKIGRDSWLVNRLRPAYESALDLMYLGRGVPYSLNGVQYRIAPQARIAFKHEFDPETAACLKSQLAADDIIFDIGAQVGVYTLQLAHWSRPSGKIIAFEPNPDACHQLQRHIRMNGLTERVEVVPMAVGGKSGSLEFFTEGISGAGRLERPNAELSGKARSFTVNVTTLDEFCEQRGIWPTWIKLDIEGYEFKALAAAEHLIKRSPETRWVVELHPHLWPLTDTTKESALALLNSLGIQWSPLSSHPDPWSSASLVLLQHRITH